MLFLYVLRSLRSRFASVIPTVVTISSAVLVICVLVAGLDSLRSAVLDSGSVSNGMVLSSNAEEDVMSTIDRETMERLKVAPGIKRGQGGPLLSPELRNQLRVIRRDGGLDYVDMRGVEAVALEVHPQIQIVDGALPTPGSPGVVIGSRLVDKYEGFQRGGTIQVGKHRWPVVGTFRAPGTKFESEIWCDRRALAEEFQLGGYSIAAFQLEQPDSLAEVQRVVKDMHDQRLQAISERTYYQRLFSRAAMYIRAVELVILALGLGVIFSTTNTMYAAFLERIPEFGTMLAIGYTKRRMAGLLFQESLMLALVSGAIGLAGVWLTDGYSMVYQSLALSFTLRIGARIALVGVAVSLAIGILGALISVVQVLRLDTLSALREG